MKKLIKKSIAAILCIASVASATSMAACFKRDEIEIDESKTQLYVFNFDGGYGSQWLFDVIADFEAKNAEVSYESGKKGVQIVPTCNKTLASDLEKSIMEGGQEVVFTQNFNCLFDYIAKDYLLDITDMITQTIPGESKSIEDKMTEQEKRFLHVDLANTGAGKYYAVPHYSVYSGIIYDIDLFEDKGLYLLKEGGYSIPGAFNDGKYVGTGTLANGSDGKEGTYDDGLPATYDEFFALCDYMVREKSITPFNWTGKSSTYYLSDVRLSLYADYEGANQMALNYDLKGTAKNLISVTADGAVTKLGDTEIAPQNAYELAKQAGAYYSTDFMNKIVSDTRYHNATKTGGMTYTHLQAQSDFLYSSFKGAPIAMLFDGAWWENEASDTFTAMEQYSLGKYDRRFGFLPFPKQSAEQVGEKFTVYDGKMAYGVLSKAMPSFKYQLAKDFLQFCYTDENLAEFSVKTNSFRDLDYSLTEEQVSQLSGFGQYLYNIKVSNNMDVVYPLSSSVEYLNNPGIGNISSTRVNNTSTDISNYLGKRSTVELFNAAIELRREGWSQHKF